MAAAAAELSEGLSTLLASAPRAADPALRWVPLPEYHQRPPAVRLENLTESARALSTKTRRR